MKMLRNRVKPVSTGVARPLSTSRRRLTGATLQRRRKKIWTADPTCKGCGRVVAYPRGFELDHIVPLWQGGEDVEENCQILCVWFDESGVKQGCHASKTAGEASAMHR